MRRNGLFYPRITVGLDLGDRKSVICELDAAGTVVRRSTVATTRGARCFPHAGRVPGASIP